MGEPSLIAAYLADLERSLGDRDVVAEVEDHLSESAAALVRSGLDRQEAEARAVARFGPVQPFVDAEREGDAMPTTFTRLAGLGGLLAPASLAVGAVVNDRIDRGAVHGLGVFLLVAGVAMAVVAFVGLRSRHRHALGRFGLGAVWLLAASPFLSAPFGWGAGAALVGWVGLASALLAVGLARRRAAALTPAVLFGASLPIGIVAGGVGALIGRDTAGAVAVTVPAFALGLAWLGWGLWREAAVPRPAAPGPLATA
jgi:hypothetical protein